MNLDIKIDFNEIFDKAFAALAKAMNIAEEQLLPILVKQMFVEGIYGLIITVSVLLLLTTSLIAAFWTGQRDNEGAIIISWAGIVVFGIWFLGIMLNGYGLDSVTKTFNPEYAVIQEVVDIAKELVGDNK